MTKRLRVLWIVVAVALVSAGIQAQQAVAPLARGERIQNLDQFKDRLKQYHACTCICGCYQKDLDLEAERAIAFLRQRAAHNTQQKKLALVLDIDETTLSNYEDMQKADFAYDSKAFNAWVETAAAPAIPGTLRLYKEAQRLGVSVMFLTGRPDAERVATEKNLHAAGFDGYTQLLMREPVDAKLTAIQFKSAQRARMVAEGYTLVLSVGDQWSDLHGKPEAEYSVKYPNPYYFIP